jgi:hypothetical protein
MDDIDQHILDLTDYGVPKDVDQDGTVTDRHPVCQFDIENLDRTRDLIEAALSQEFFNALDPKITDDMTGVHIFLLAVSFIEPPTASTARALLSKLQEKKLNQVPGMDVNTFNITVKDLVTRIQGCCKKREHIPADLVLTVTQCYLDTGIQEFDMEVIGIRRELDRDLDKYTPTQVQTMLGDLYDSLVNTNRWAHKNKLQELAEEVGQLKALLL